MEKFVNIIYCAIKMETGKRKRMQAKCERRKIKEAQKAERKGSVFQAK